MNTVAIPLDSDHPQKFVSPRSSGWAGCCWAMFLLVILLPVVALAQTNVVGAIAANTRWIVANAPYVINGDVVIQNSAVLTIDPGVTVYMGANASVVVESGGIVASGMVANPIRVLSDKARQGQGTAPGDWKQWVFNAGTTSTRLENVIFEHGSGLVVNGSAPVFNSVDIRNQQGPAISVDLAASPSGIGNRASGNTINGILVPAGEIGGSVRWGLLGIPYVVQSGTLSVGISPKVDAIVPNSLQQGETATFIISGNRLSGLSKAEFDRSGIRAQILPGGSDTQASISVTAESSAALGKVLLRLLTDAGEIQIVNALTLDQSQPVLTEALPGTLYSGQGTVNLVVNGRNFTPQSVVLANGTAVETVLVSASQLRSTIAVPEVPGTLKVRVRSPDPVNVGQQLNSNELLLPVLAAQLKIVPASFSIIKGSQRNLLINLPYPASVGGLVLNLLSSAPSVATVPASANVPEGQSSVTVPLSSVALGNTVITASKAGYISGQSDVAVIAPPTLQITPSTVTTGVGRASELTIQSSQPAGSNGISVNLVSSDVAVATVPSTVTILAGSSSAKATVTSQALGTTKITAQAVEYVGAETTVNVRQVSLNLPASTLVAPGMGRSIPLMLTDPAPIGGLVVNFASSNSAVVGAPASVTVPAGQTTANFMINGMATGSASITASAEGYQSAVLPVTVEAVSISIGSPAVASIAAPSEMALNYSVNISKPAPAGGIIVSLAMTDGAIASVEPSSITIAEGQTSGGAFTATITGKAKGSTTLSATSAGLNSATIPVTVSSKAEFAFSKNVVTVGKGLKTYLYEVYLSRKVDNVPYSPNQALTVNLSSADGSKVRVPATVTIPAGQSSVYFSVTGVDLTGGTAVMVDATAPGYSAPTTKLSVNVIPPVLNFNELDGNRSPTSSRDNVWLGVTVPGAYYASNQVAVTDIPINLSVVEANPAGIVDGFYSAATGGPVVTQVLLKADNYGTPFFYIGTPTGAGSYKVQASIADTSSATSGMVTVTSPGLRFVSAASNTVMVVGKGLKNYLYEIRVERVVNGTAFNGSDALTVNLSSADESKVRVPATVTIPAGQSSVNFYVNGVDLTGGTAVMVDATAPGYSAPTTKLSVNVIPPALDFNELDGNRSPTSSRDNVWLRVTAPGANYPYYQLAVTDIPINLSVVEANPAGIVDGFYSAATGGAMVTQVLLKADTNSTPFFYIGTPTGSGNYKVKASIADTSSATSGMVTVTSPGLRFVSAASNTVMVVGKGLKNNPYEVRVERVVNGTAFNGSEALTVNLSSADGSKVRVPATVTIPAGQSSVYFSVTGVDLTGGTAVMVDATAPGYSAPTTKLSVNVIPPVLIFSELDGNRSPTSGRDNVRLRVVVSGAVYYDQTAVTDTPINLSVVEANPAGIVDGFYSAATGGPVVTQVLLKADSSYSEYAYVGTPTGAGSYKVQASIADTSNLTSGVVTVSSPELRIKTQNPSGTVIVGKGLKTYLNEVWVERVVNGTEFNGGEALTVNLACVASAICKTPASVTIPAGQSRTYFYVEGHGNGNTVITGSATGYVTSPDLAVTVVKPQLSLSGLATTTKIGQQSNFSVSISVSGTYYSNQMALEPIAVNLTSSAPNVATVPQTVTIQTGNSSTGYAPALTGVAEGTVTITASGADSLSATSDTVTVTP